MGVIEIVWIDHTIKGYKRCAIVLVWYIKQIIYLRMPEDPKAVVKQLIRAASVSVVTMIGCVCLGAGVGWGMERVVPAQGLVVGCWCFSGCLVGFINCTNRWPDLASNLVLLRHRVIKPVFLGVALGC